MSKVGAERDHSFNPDIPVPRPIEPLDAPPHLDFFPAHPGRTAGTRTAADIFSVVVHATAADNPATSTGAFFQSPPEDPKDVGSAQLTVDNDMCIRSVADLGIANGVPPLNQEGLHIEQRGLGEFPREKWLGERRNTMLRCAFTSRSGAPPSTSRSGSSRWLTSRRRAKRPGGSRRTRTSAMRSVSPRTRIRDRTTRSTCCWRISRGSQGGTR